MNQPPTTRIVRGSATPAEEAAIEAAVMKMWRESLSRTAAADRIDGWTISARIEGTGRAQESLPRTARAWRLGGRIAATPVSPLHPGRGDAR